MFKTKLKKSPYINLVPMIDVIFFLLVFFMVFTTFRTTPYGVDLKLPKATNVVQTNAENIIVHITSDGHLYLKDKPVTPEELQGQVKGQLEKKPDIVIVLKADENARYKSLVKVMDVVSEVGGYNFALAAEKVESQQK